MPKRIVSALFLAAGAIALVLFSSPRDPVDAEDLTKEQLTKLRELYASGRSLYLEKKHTESNESYGALLELVPEETEYDEIRANVSYEMARNHALQGEKKEAFARLDTAIENGFRDEDVLQKDVDFTALWTDDKFLALVEKLRKLRHEDLASVARLPVGMKDLEGKVIAAKDLEGKVVVVDVWGTWCPPCRMEIPHFIRLQSEYGEKGLEVIGLTWENQAPSDRIRERVQRFATQTKVNYRMALLTREELGQIPDLNAFPTTFFIGRDGTVRKRMVGYHNFKDLEREVKILLAEKVEKEKKSPE